MKLKIRRENYFSTTGNKPKRLRPEAVGYQLKETEMEIKQIVDANDEASLDALIESGKAVLVSSTNETPISRPTWTYEVHGRTVTVVGPTAASPGSFLRFDD